MMKRYLAAASALFLAALSAVYGVTGDAGLLPNYDARVQEIGRTGTRLTAAVRQADNQLKARVPGLQISRDPILGTPRSVTVRGGFLNQSQSLAAGPRLSSRSNPASDSHAVIKGFVNDHAAVFGHDASVLDSARVTRDGVSPASRMRTVVWQQAHSGIDVFDGVFVAHVTSKGELVGVEDHLLTNASAAIGSVTALKLSQQMAVPAITAAQALRNAAANAGVQMPEDSIHTTKGPLGADHDQIVGAPGMVVPAYAKLVWLPMDASSAKLAWRIVANLRPMERYLMVVDAESGVVLVRRSLTVRLKEISLRVFTNDSPLPFSPGHDSRNRGQPRAVQPVVIKTTGLDAEASPLGWINDTDTRLSGNNGTAYLDRDLDFTADGSLLDGGPTRSFEYPINLEAGPATYANASAAELFWRINWYHDRLYELGFTEQFGNYQRSNFGRGGEGDDAIVGLVQAGMNVGEADNAFFMPSPDGTPGYVAMFTWNGPLPDRDGALDSEVVLHELTHGLSTRLVGGGVGIYKAQTQGLGEGWSDFYALALLSEASDDVNGNYAMGAYVAFRMMRDFEDNYYFGIRRYPYTTDMSKNPFTLKDIDPSQANAHQGVPVSPVFGGASADEAHSMGEVWCSALWEVRAAVIERLGWERGNILALQLVTEGMKLSPENCTFLEARDAIIQADLVLTGGSMYDDMWFAFAKRGFGYTAAVPDSDRARGVKESFDLPPDVSIGAPDGILEVKILPAPGSLLLAGEDTQLFVRVSDSGAVTNANVHAEVNGLPVVFRNDGVAPDVFSRDNTYSGSFRAPANGTNVVVTFFASAPGKMNSTNEVSYFIVAKPQNDAFSLATKIPPGGSSYFTSNKGATTEPGEPVHAGAPTMGASLWWNFIAATNGEVLVDTGGSEFTTVIAIYTNSALPALRLVANAAGSMTGRQGAYLKFNAKAGLAYRIAVASREAKSTGTLRLEVSPDGQPDTTAPVALVTSPASGTMSITNMVRVTGTAVDADPSASGVRSIQVTIATMPGAADEIITLDARAAFDGPTSTNWALNVSLRPGLNKISVSAVDYVGNHSAPSTIEVMYRAVDPNNDFFAAASFLSITSGVSSVNTALATKEVGEANHAGTVGGKSAWWYFDAPFDGALSLSTTNSMFDTVLAVYTGSKVSQLTRVADNDDAVPDSGFSEMTISVRGGTRYYVAVDGYDGASGVVFLSHSFNPAELFTVTLVAGTGGQVPSSLTVHSNGLIQVIATPDGEHIFDLWNGSIVALANPLFIAVRSNMVLNARFVPRSYSEDFESGSLAGLEWRTSGNALWKVQTNQAAHGLFAAGSGLIGNRQSSSLTLTANFKSGSGSFALRVDSEPVWDRLNFLIDGALMQYWSGNVPWSAYTFPVPAGTHTLEWRYSKDNLNAAGVDAAFIDNVTLPLVLAADSATPALLSLQRQFDGAYYIDLRGQTRQTYVLQVSTNLVNWSNLSTNILNGDTWRVLDTASRTSATRFYRALIP